MCQRVGVFLVTVFALAGCAAQSTGPTDAGQATLDADAAGVDVPLAGTATADTATPDAQADADAAPPVDVTLTGACICGDGICFGGCGETIHNCATDCGSCGDGVCSPGEGPATCPVDCCGACGDGVCKGYACGENPDTCKLDCGTACGNGKCDKSESPTTCPQDCLHDVCGNGICEPADGGPDKCPEDCGAACGNCVCDKGESTSNCPTDCGFCGDGVCSFCPKAGEDATTCAADCKGSDCVPGTPGACDDGNACTVDSCTPNQICVHLPSVATCTDDDVCTLGDACQSSACVPGQAVLDCDDSNACTADTCVPVIGCKHDVLTGNACSDGDVCTTQDHCKEGVCLGVAASACDDQNACTDDACDPKKGCQHAPNSQPCDDGNVCTTNDACTGGGCTGTTASCDDGNSCTTDGCLPVTGCYHTAFSGYCSDGDTCSVSDACAQGVCLGKVIDCNDQNACTSDTCVSGQGCVHTAIDMYCDDGDACTQLDRCTGGVCVGASVNCDDKNPCTQDGCDPGKTASGGCIHLPASSTCTDGDPCTLGDACVGGACVSGQAVVDCNDGNGCTADACVTGIGCTHTTLTGNVCSDGLPCTGGDHCVEGTCVGAWPVDCSDDNPCTSDPCDNKLGCLHTAAPGTCDDGNACTTGDACTQGVCAGATLPCGDSNPCTSDLCSPTMGCYHATATGYCDDGDGCTANDACANSVCVGQAIDCSDGNACTSDSCQKGAGCVHVAFDTACNDGDICTTGDHCAAGICVGAAQGCDDGNPCTLDGCDGVKNPTTGCTHLAVAATCSDGDPCTLGDACVGGACTASVPMDCDDGNSCTADSCIVFLGCKHVTLTGSACSDGDACTSGDHCQDGGCFGTTPTNCDDGNPCTDDTCPSKGGCVHAANSASCDDNNLCTTGDACQKGACGGAGVSCGDGNPCTLDACAALTGCYHTPTTGYCDDGDVCTANDVCAGGACLGKAVSCDDANPCTSDSCKAPGGCSHTPVTGNCDDGNACTQNDTCLGNTCVGTAVACNDGNPCTSDGCDMVKNPLTGCVHLPAAGTCSDGDVCTIGDVCLSGICTGGPIDCTDGLVCTDDLCDPAGGCVHLVNTAACDDGDPCTTGDTCNAKVCAGKPVACDDGKPCTLDSCTAAEGCVHTLAQGLCNDGNTCTQDTCQGDGTCAHTATPGGACDDGQACTTGETCAGSVCGNGLPLLWSTLVSGGSSSSFSAIRPAPDGGFAIAGTQVSQEYLGRVVRFSSTGAVLWNKTFAGSGAWLSLIDRGPNGWVVAGASHNFYPWAMGLSETGDVAWTWSGYSVSSGASINGIAATPDGGALLVGSYGNTSWYGVVSNTGVLTTNAWDSNFPQTSFQAVAALQGGLFAAAGGCTGNAAFVHILDAGGLDHATLNFTLGTDCDAFAAVAPASDGGMLLGTQAGRLLRTSAGGTAIWELDTGVAPTGIVQVAGGDWLTSTATSPLLSLVSPSGTAVWQLTSGVAGMPGLTLYGVAATSDGRIAFTGSSGMNGAVGVRDRWDTTSCGASGLCFGTDPVDCFDNNPCTDDSCDAKTGACVHTNNFGACSDGSACTADTCGGGKCQSTPISCDDANPCTTDSCNVVDGCKHAFNDTPCGGDGSSHCAMGACCTPNCAYKACGSDGCGGQCGVCASGLACGSMFTCDPWDPKSMALIPAGTFWMGCSPDDTACLDDEKPQHLVSLSPYYIGRYEITVAQYQACVNAGLCVPPAANPDPLCAFNATPSDSLPMNCISENQAKGYCLNMIPGGRLPTEAQWERAARGGCATLGSCKSPPVFPWGDMSPWCGGGMAAVCGSPEPVGSYPGGATVEGVYDMAGNVAEFVSDLFDSAYYATSPSVDPQGPTVSQIGASITRGGDYQASNGPSGSNQRSGARTLTDGSADNRTGFRCARSYP